MSWMESSQTFNSAHDLSAPQVKFNSSIFNLHWVLLIYAKCVLKNAKVLSRAKLADSSW
jgi:hypothetical protein